MPNSRLDDVNEELEFNTNIETSTSEISICEFDGELMPKINKE